MTIQTLISMQAISKSFGRVQVLSDVDFSVGNGEIVALLGANGAGKSTLVKILTGNYAKDSGELKISDRSVDISSPADAISSGIKLLPQELSVFPDLTVAENILLGAMPSRKFAGVDIVDKRAARALASELLARLGLGDIDLDRRLGSLSHPIQRIVEIARALAGDAKLLIMDEPTASLAQAEVQMLFAIINRLKAQGVAIVYISHYLDEVFAISDRIVVLRDGRNAGEFATATADKSAVIETIVGTRIGDIYPEYAAHGKDTLALSVKELTVARWLKGVSFDAVAGKITGAYGLIGSGAEVLGRALFGAVPGTSATEISLDGKPYRPSDPAAAAKVGIGLLAAERKREGIIPMLSLRENLSLPNIGQVSKRGMVLKDLERASARTWIKKLSIRTNGTEQAIGTLSGGNQQKVCLARWINGPLQLLILEEPTRGVDMGARKEIYRQIRELASAGLAVIVISSDPEEVAGLADRSIVLAGGRVTMSFEHPVSAVNLMNAASCISA